MNENVEERHVNSKTGNGLFAKKDFHLGDVIFEEVPLVMCQFAWNADCLYTSCEHCLRPLETAEENARRLSGNRTLSLPFPDLDTIKPSEYCACVTCGAKYCSGACQETASRLYHKRMCHVPQSHHPLDLLRETWKQTHYPPEEFNVVAIAKLAAMFVSAAADAGELQKLSAALARFQSNVANVSEGIVHKMLGPNYQIQLQVLRPFLAEAFPEECLKQWWTTDGFMSIFAVFARNAQGVGVSSFGAWQDAVRKDARCTEGVVKILDDIYEAIQVKTGEEFMDNEGSALYVLQRASNHSCDPNTEVKFLHNNSTLSLIARRPIKAGEEVFISYLDDCELRRSRHSRQKSLRENYLFHCACGKCQQEEVDQADVTSEDEDADWEDDEPAEDDDPMEEN